MTHRVKSYNGNQVTAFNAFYGLITICSLGPGPVIPAEGVHDPTVTVTVTVTEYLF
jgi:hypothetical protein